MLVFKEIHKERSDDMYDETFKDASIWAVFWRSILAVIGILFLTAMLSVIFQFNHLTFLGIISDGLLYFAFYKITLSQMRKQSLSIEALSQPRPKGFRTLLQLSGVTVLVAIAATLFIYFALTVLTFIPALFDTIVNYLISISIGEPLSPIYILLTAVVFAPIVEEIVFRGYILNKWVDKYGISKGIWFSSLAFMILHIQSFFVPQLLLGLFCGIIYTKYKNLFYPIFIHALYNFIVIAPSLFVQTDPMDEYAFITEITSLKHVLPTEYVVYSVIFVVLIGVLTVIFKKLTQSIPHTRSPYAENLNDLQA